MLRKTLTAGLVLAGLAVACGGGGGESSLSGEIPVDGSSTVQPLSSAMAEEFMAENRGVEVTVGVSGTGAGFEKFCRGETMISDASRPIKDEEAATCREQGIEPIELAVATDGLTVVVNAQNDFVKCLSVDVLANMFKPDSTVRTWRDVNPEWPAEEISFFSPGADSGTFDYFTEEVVGEAKASRSEDVSFSEDDNILVQGIANERYAIGYFGYAYFQENSGLLKAVEIDGGQGCVAPTEETIASGDYTPLSRPLFIYASKSALSEERVSAFVEFYLDNVSEIAPEVGYLALPAAKLEESKQAFREALPE